MYKKVMITANLILIYFLLVYIFVQKDSSSHSAQLADKEMFNQAAAGPQSEYGDSFSSMLAAPEEDNAPQEPLLFNQQAMDAPQQMQHLQEPQQMQHLHEPVNVMQQNAYEQPEQHFNEYGQPIHLNAYGQPMHIPNQPPPNAFQQEEDDDVLDLMDGPAAPQPQFPQPGGQNLMFNPEPMQGQDNSPMFGQSPPGANQAFPYPQPQYPKPEIPGLEELENPPMFDESVPGENQGLDTDSLALFDIEEDEMKEAPASGPVLKIDTALINSLIKTAPESRELVELGRWRKGWKYLQSCVLEGELLTCCGQDKPKMYFTFHDEDLHNEKSALQVFLSKVQGKTVVIMGDSVQKGLFMALAELFKLGK